MQSKNPVFARAGEFSGRGYATFDARSSAAPTAAPARSLEELYRAPSATVRETGRMSLDDVLVRTATTLAILVAAGAITWFALPKTGALLFGAMFLGLALGLVNSFKRTPSPALIMTYAAVEGVFLGSISFLFERSGLNGIVSQAVLATVVTFAAMLGAYKVGAIRATPKFARFLIIATVGYVIFGLVNLVGVLFGLQSVYSMGLLGVVVSLLGVGLASLNLILDFDYVERGLRAGLPRSFAWQAAFGLTVTLVWLYIEMLRLIAILRSGD